MTIQKYRPCLTTRQIQHILSLCKNDLTLESLSVIKVLSPFQSKIENCSLTPAYSIEKNSSVLASFGSQNTGIENSSLTPNEKRERAYKKWLCHPDSCSVYELELVQTHRFTSNLMSAEEQEQFERENNLF